MKKLILTVLCCYFLTLALAQKNNTQPLTIKGTVIDSATMKPMSYVTVALQDAKTKEPVKSSLTKDDGSFELKAAVGDYELVLAFVGYQNKVFTIPADKTGIVNEGRLLLQPSNNELKSVTVSAVKPLMEQEVDRISYNVAADPESKALTALDMMRKVPLLTVDASDNILLKGSGNYKILVNGKESALLAKNPSDVLRSMPATNIEKIEVITTPPAKYDAEGLAGIINIITKKNADEGYNIGFNARYNSVWGPGININSTVKQGKFGFSGYLGTGKQNKSVNPYTNTQTFFNPPSVLAQNGESDYTGNYKYADGEFSYEIDSLNLLTASVDFNVGNNFQDSYGYTRTSSNGAVTQQYLQQSSDNSSYNGFDAGINYQLGFKRSKDQLLTLSYEYNYSPNKQNNANMFLDTINYRQPDFTQYNNAGNKEHTIQVDYAEPFKKLSLEAGAKAIIRNNFSNFQSDTLVSSTNQYNLNQGQTNDFNYHQDVYSLYNSYQLKFTKWSAKAGLRLEETTIGADFSSEGATLNTNYSNFIPSVSVQHTLNKTSNIDFGFTERIERPGIYELNPFVDRSNPQFVNTGNPNLKPELSHVFELNYSYFSKGSINTGISYSFSNNSIQNVTSLKTENINNMLDTVTYTTYQNLGSNKTLGFNINANYSFGSKISLSVNGQLNHEWLSGFYNGQLYNNNGNMGQVFANIGYKFAKGYRFGLNAGYFSGYLSLQGNSSYYIYNSFVISKDFLNKNASISFVANNPYSKYWQGNSYTRTNAFYQQSDYQEIYRSFAFRISFKFGKLNSDIKKNQHGINNDETSGGSKSSSSGNN